ncbi:uncharacterized protein LOC131014957 [Salvia miltiorrhiza]|uniref:uncharacterized protein LOC131014957 n=1 Tax=Salvia miltiorrhiza TaxID=226208 RepID=UPI0025AC97EF|nr:uncharacterized protein LOC131014957 [Salvia miltiorrhiza]
MKKADKDAASSTTREETSQAIAAMEKNVTRKGVAVYTCIGTGNIYYHMPQNRQVTHVNKATGSKGSGSKATASKGSGSKAGASKEIGSKWKKQTNEGTNVEMAAQNVGVVNTQESRCSTGGTGEFNQESSRHGDLTQV